MKVFIEPKFNGPDTGEGGIRRVVEAQRKFLPQFGVEVVDSIDDADLMHSHAMINTKTNKPIVVTSHGLYWDDYKWPNEWQKHANKQVLSAITKADSCISVSQWVARAIERNTWVKPTVIYHGIDPVLWPVRGASSEYDAKLSNRRYVLWNKTRVDPVCSPAYMQELARLAPDIAFLSTFGEETRNVHITGKVNFEEAKKYIYNASVYLCTSRETFGIGTLEAMAAGVPVLGWEWGGQSEFIENERDGFLVPPGDFVGLERGLRYCLANQERMGQAAREKVLKQFTWQTIIPQYVELYKKLLYKLDTQTKVSVVITLYNLGKYLVNAVGSVTEQPSVGGTEVIIVDDASTDDSGKIADSICEQHNKRTDRNDVSVRVIHNEYNQYLAGALNTGIKEAGKYILPLDADNMLGANILPVLVNALDNDECDIAYGAMQVIEETGKVYTSSWPTEFDFSKQLNHQNQITSTALYRKAIYDRIGGYRQRCKTAEDADFWCRATSYGARAKKVTDGVVLVYRDRHDSMSHLVPDWPWHQWYPWYKNRELAPPVSPLGGNIWSYEPPLISVIIPVGPGHTKYVIDAVDSLCAQSFIKWDCIVVNDSGESIDWIHPFVRIFDTGGSKGPAYARNVGISNSRGNFIIPLDADDYLQPNALEVLYKSWQDAGGGNIYVYSDWIVQETGEIKQCSEYDCKAILKQLIHPVTGLYLKSSWKAAGGFDENIKAWEDWDFVISLAAQGTCGIRAPEPLIQYRIHAGSRRESMYANREQLIVEIRDKWKKYFDGSVQLMACGCSGKLKAPSMPVSSLDKRISAMPAVAHASSRDDMVLIEYVGRASGPLMYRGAKTNTMYRFGLDESHRIKYVHKGDAEVFLARQDFREKKASADTLQAAGMR